MLLSLLTAFSIAPPFLSCAHARDKTIIVDENNPPRTRQIKPSWNTRVISIINTRAADTENSPADDICPALGGYYCKSVGREAWLKLEPMVPDKTTISGKEVWLDIGAAFIGRIAGVAWKDKGGAIGRYLGQLEAGFSVEKSIRKNHLSSRDSFYFIIDTGTESPVLVETHRIIIRE